MFTPLSGTLEINIRSYLDINKNILSDKVLLSRKKTDFYKIMLASDPQKNICCE